MKKLLLSGLCLLSFHAFAADVTSVTVNDVDYPINTLIQRQIGPGVQYMRLRMPTFPLNINMLKIDLTNPYNSMETTQASDALYKTEALVNAAKRQTYEGHKALAGANANFWCVPTQEPYSDLLLGVTFNGNMKNGQIITETNCRADQWVGGPQHSGIFGVSDDNTAFSGSCTWEGYISNSKFGVVEFAQANKIVREDEICIYNSFFGSTRNFIPADQEYRETDKKVHFVRHENVTTEVLLTMNPGQEWCSGESMKFTVAEVRKEAGKGTLGNYDLAICGRGNKLAYLDQLEPGDVVDVAYFWRNASGDMMKFRNLVGGNAQVMIDGELTKENDRQNYNSQVYSRTGYGTSADGKTAYVIVIDKSSSKWGNSAGCNTKVMCAIAKAYGCMNLTNFDAGGSAEMLVQGKIINTTTESNPRAVANGMLVYSTAPTDNEITSLEFYDLDLEMPRYSTFSPRIIAYNKYGDIITDDFKDFTLSCPEVNGTCSDNEIFVSGVSGLFTLTASYGDITVAKQVNVVDSEIIVRIPELLIDDTHPYTMEITAQIGMNTFVYDPTKIEWDTEDHSIALIDAQGVVIGVSNGTTNIVGTIGDFVTKSKVTVEIAPTPEIHANDWTNFSATGTSGCSIESFADGVVTFKYASPRAPYVTLKNEIDDFFGIPERIEIDFNTTALISEVAVNAMTPAITMNNIVAYTPAEGDAFTPSTDHTIVIPVSDLCDATDHINYPVRFEFIRFTPQKTTDNKGTHTINIKDVRAIYNSYDAIHDITCNPVAENHVSLSASVVAPAQHIVISAAETITGVQVYGIDGRLASSTHCNSQATTIAAPMSRGLYIVNVCTAKTRTSCKVLVK